MSKGEVCRVLSYCNGEIIKPSIDSRVRCVEKKLSVEGVSEMHLQTKKRERPKYVSVEKLYIWQMEVMFDNSMRKYGNYQKVDMSSLKSDPSTLWYAEFIKATLL